MFTAFIIAIEIIVGILLQTAVFPYLEIGGIAPDLLMIITVAAGYQMGRSTGMWTGLFCGLMLDFTNGGVLGVYALFLMLIGYLNGYLKAYYVPNDTLFPLLLLGISEFIFNLLIYLFEFLIRGRLNIFFFIRRIMLPKVLYTMVAGIVVYMILDIIYQHLILSHQKKLEEQKQ